MLVTALITAALAFLCALPGLILTRGVASQPGVTAAAATASIVGTMLATALAGTLMAAMGGELPAWSLIPVAFLAACGAWALSRERRWHWTRPEWQGVAYAAVMVGYGLLALALAFEPSPSGGLLVHSYYNADWFKHLGHVYAVANYGVPPRDIFGGGEPLHYYWLSYLLPGAATQLGGDAWAALATVNAIITLLFALTFYALLRMTSASPNLALGAALIGTLVSAPMIYFLKLVGGESLPNLIAGGEAPEPALMLIPQVIPQHALVLTVLMAWVLLARAIPHLRVLVLTALAASLTISTLLGAMVLAVYGLLTLWSRGWRALPELALMAIGSGALLLALGVVQVGAPDSALASPLFGDAYDAEWYVRPFTGILRLIGMVGLAFVAALFVFRHWKPGGVTELPRRLAICLTLSAIGCVFFSQALLPARPAIEILIRARLLLAIAAALVLAWSLSRAFAQGGRQRALAIGLVVLLIVVALPAAIVRTTWLADFGERFTTEVPADDLLVLADLRRASEPRDQVWQFPEPPEVALPSGEDAWAPVFAGRTVPNSLRATDYAAARPHIEQSTRFFADESIAIPQQMNWVYLSRALHPASYEALVTRMRGEPGWQQRSCYPDACLFARSQGA